MIQAINDLNLTWKADTCKLQTHHANYGSHCQKEKEEARLSLAQTASKEEEASSFGQQENFAGAWEEAQKFQKKYPDAESIPQDELPANFDWRNIKGVDFTSKHRDQGHCGSCYTVSFTQIVEQRLRLKYGKDMP